MGDICNQITELIATRNGNIILNKQSRYDVNFDVYSGYTQGQLDEKRKTEILRYNRNASQSGNLTKKQNWARVAKGFKTNTNSYTCNGQFIDIKTLPGLTSGCDVPGPVIMLQYNPNVPLYNHATQKNIYSNLNNNNTQITNESS